MGLLEDAFEFTTATGKFDPARRGIRIAQIHESGAQGRIGLVDDVARLAAEAPGLLKLDQPEPSAAPPPAPPVNPAWIHGNGPSQYQQQREAHALEVAQQLRPYALVGVVLLVLGLVVAAAGVVR